MKDPLPDRAAAGRIGRLLARELEQLELEGPPSVAGVQIPPSEMPRFRVDEILRHDLEARDALVDLIVRELVVCGPRVELALFSSGEVLVRLHRRFRHHVRGQAVQSSLERQVHRPLFHLRALLLLSLPLFAIDLVLVSQGKQVILEDGPGREGWSLDPGLELQSSSHQHEGRRLGNLDAAGLEVVQDLRRVQCIGRDGRAGQPGQSVSGVQRCLVKLPHEPVEHVAVPKRLPDTLLGVFHQLLDLCRRPPELRILQKHFRGCSLGRLLVRRRLGLKARPAPVADQPVLLFDGPRHQRLPCKWLVFYTPRSALPSVLCWRGRCRYLQHLQKGVHAHAAFCDNLVTRGHSCRGKHRIDALLRDGQAHEVLDLRGLASAHAGAEAFETRLEVVRGHDEAIVRSASGGVRIHLEPLPHVDAPFHRIQEHGL
eukprot:scaffold1272_cov250-Pinguiococcus_pyrenoidosus.AAC.1